VSFSLFSALAESALYKESCGGGVAFFCKSCFRERERNEKKKTRCILRRPFLEAKERANERGSPPPKKKTETSLSLFLVRSRSSSRLARLSKQPCSSSTGVSPFVVAALPGAEGVERKKRRRAKEHRFFANASIEPFSARLLLIQLTPLSFHPLLLL
jgi:hypothetical protein